nr:MULTISPECIES: threonine/serine exporter family protein [Helcobacillus]
MRIGEIMLASGAAASEVTATMLRITASSGIRNVSVQVTFNELSVSYLPDEESTPFTRIRAVADADMDFSKLDEAEKITSDYIHGELALAEAITAAERTRSAPKRYSNALTTAGWAIMSGAAAVGFGAGTMVMLFAAITAGIIYNLLGALARRGIPMFFAQVIGGFLSVMAAILAYVIDPSVNASIVVIACIILLLAGLTSIGAMQDAITGWYITASARILQTIMLTIGVVIGVRAGLMFSTWVGVDISVSSSLPSTLASVIVVLVAGAVMGLGSSIGVQSPRRVIAVSTLLATMSSVVSFALRTVGLEQPWNVGVTALLVGCFAVIGAQRLRTPAVSMVIVGVLPLVPGSIIYRGLLALGDDPQAGALSLFTAVSVAVAISAGVVFGQLLMARLLLGLQAASTTWIPVMSAPFSTARRRRVLNSRTAAAKATNYTLAIPVVRLEPGEADPTEPEATTESQSVLSRLVLGSTDEENP